MRRVTAACLVLAGLIVLTPSVAFAQATITGVVKDSSGGVLPGVTVEAASPDLIEKVRTATTDADGQYRIIDLRGGTYSLTFSLPGFSTVRREGIQLAGTFVATINADLRVGALEETVIVTGESPIVDVQSVSRQTTLTNEVINQIPAVRSYAGLLSLMPNMVTPGGAAANSPAPNMVVFGAAGGRANEGRLQVDGISVGTAFNGAGVSAYVVDVNNVQEIVLTASGGLGEAEVGGPTLNILPREGGNTISGQLYPAKVTPGMVGSNYTDELRTRGLTTPGAFENLWDYNFGIGGPILKDRLWYFGQLRTEGYKNTVPGMFANANAGNPNSWTYVPDRSRPAYQAASFNIFALRLTAQLNAKNKVSVSWDEQKPCEGAAFERRLRGLPSLRTGSDHLRRRVADAGMLGNGRPGNRRVPQYLPAGAAGALDVAPHQSLSARGRDGHVHEPVGWEPMPGQDPNLIRTVDQCTTGVAPGQPCEHGIANVTFRSPNWGTHWTTVYNYRGGASLVMSSHNIKAGYQGSHLGDNQTNHSNDQFLTYRLNNGVPNQFTQTINKFTRRQWVRTAAFYVQDSYTVPLHVPGRAPLRPCVELLPGAGNHPGALLPPGQDLPGHRWVLVQRSDPARRRRGGCVRQRENVAEVQLRALPRSRAERGLLHHQQPDRPAVDHRRPDMDGRQQRQGRRLQPAEPARAEPGDDGQHRHLRRRQPQLRHRRARLGARPVADHRLGRAHGRLAVGHLDPAGSHAARVRRIRLPAPLAVEFHHHGQPGRRSSDYDRFSVIIPSDPRLPNGGGGQLDDLFNITQAASARATDNFVTLADRFGEQKQVTNSFSLNVTARPRFGLTMQGGFNYALTNTNSCEVRAALPEIDSVDPWCDDEHVAAARDGARQLHGAEDRRAAGDDVPQRTGPAAGGQLHGESGEHDARRPFGGVSQTITVNLIEPGTMYGDRANQLDLRVAKNLRFGGTRTNVGVDVFNILNSNPVLTYNQAYSPTTTTWLRPTSVLQPRYVKFSAQINF